MQENRFVRTSSLLPLGPAAHALLRKRFEPLSDTEMAEVEFGPWELADMCEVPTAEQWALASPKILRALTDAAGIVRSRKADLVESMASLDGEELHELTDALGGWTHTFRMHLAMLEAAQDRMIVGLGVLSEAEL